MNSEDKQTIPDQQVREELLDSLMKIKQMAVNLSEVIDELTKRPKGNYQLMVESTFTFTMAMRVLNAGIEDYMLTIGDLVKQLHAKSDKA